MEDKPSYNVSQGLASAAYPQPVNLSTHSAVLIPESKIQSNNYFPVLRSRQKSFHVQFPVWQTHRLAHIHQPMLAARHCSFLVHSEIASYIHWQSTRHFAVTRDPLNTLEWSPTFTNVIRQCKSLSQGETSYPVITTEALLSTASDNLNNNHINIIYE
jgi:hypothetical protein